jgi:hypothetical protein
MVRGESGEYYRSMSFELLYCRRRSFIFVGAFFLIIGLVSSRADESKANQSTLNDGYSLFYDFCKQESQLSLLGWVKTMPPGISDYAKQISSTAEADMAVLKGMGARDNSLRLDKVALPSFEISVRQSMADDRKQQLLWGSSGAAFAQAVTMTQGEATDYGLHVAKVLSETEPDRDRAHALRRMYDQWLALHVEAYRLNR